MAAARLPSFASPLCHRLLQPRHAGTPSSLTSWGSRRTLSPWTKPAPPAAGGASRRTGFVAPRATVTAPPSAPTTPALTALRTELARLSLDAVVVPDNDPHNSEYVAPCYARRTFISRFTGSAGTAVVTASEALLWTDGRYFLQAEKQLDDNWRLMRSGLTETPTIAGFVASLPPGSAVGIDPFMHSVDNAKSLADALEAVGSRLVLLSEGNPVDTVWGSYRPPVPAHAVRVHDIRYAGTTVTEKLTSLREVMVERKASCMLLSMLDEVAWLYNVRGGDIDHSPVVQAYATIEMDNAVLYVDEMKLDAAVRAHLSQCGVEVRPYDAVVDDVAKRAARGESTWFDPASTSVAVASAAGDVGISEQTPVVLQKAKKNEAELNGMRAAHIRDGVALSSFLCWLEAHIRQGKPLTEVEAVDKLEQFRSEQEGYVTSSFTTIAGSGPNGAIIHYSPKPDSCAAVTTDNVFLLDSGGQYVDGTTDVTRTMHLGKASDHERACFTRVLQGHIAIDTAVFPPGTTGLMIDAMARVPLWRVGLDFRHGTGHGVGACLNVHEGPQSISSRPGSNRAALAEGMIVSNEPGYYEDGAFGIRIENLLIVVEEETKFCFGGKSFLGFETLTFVPLDRDMIVIEMMSDADIRWVDEYHAQVWEKLSPGMRDNSSREWLWQKTRPLATA